VTGTNAGLDALFSWRTTVGSLLAVIVTIALALLIVPELSLRAAVMGGMIAIGAMAVSRLLVWMWLRSRP
jgi:hypothetical protein